MSVLKKSFPEINSSVLQNFLHAQKSFLSSYFFASRSFAQVLQTICQQEQASFLIVLVILQHTAGLVEKRSAPRKITLDHAFDHLNIPTKTFESAIRYFAQLTNTIRYPDPEQGFMNYLQKTQQSLEEGPVLLALWSRYRQDMYTSGLVS